MVPDQIIWEALGLHRILSHDIALNFVTARIIYILSTRNTVLTGIIRVQYYMYLSRMQNEMETP